ncbi:ATP-dependent DNA helicase recG [Streptococcus agalactiae ILRI112]|nr:ATP-dependent DNA helicase recG [Streptococcus agalactiae ILRI112]
MNQTLFHYQFSPESQYLDRKSARKRPSELLKHLIAFANADGGQLVIGIEDDKQNNIITGFKDGRAYPIDEFKKIDREMRDTPLDLSFEEIPVVNHKGEEDLILVISVELSSNRVIAAPNDEVYLRQGDETVKLSYEQRTQLSYDKGQRFFEDEVVADATFEDIDDDLVQDFKNRFDIADRSTEEILKARRFLVNGKLTKAAILLFGKCPSAFFPQARVRFQRFDGTDMGTGSSFNVIKEVTFDDALPTLIIKLVILSVPSCVSSSIWMTMGNSKFCLSILNLPGLKVSSMLLPIEIILSMATIFVYLCLMIDWRFIAQGNCQISSLLTILSMNGFQEILGLPEP